MVWHQVAARSLQKIAENARDDMRLGLYFLPKPDINQLIEIDARCVGRTQSSDRRRSKFSAIAKTARPDHAGR